jgi:peptidoglycan/xylan/chitin deacetylase (PgdA/CDA1 family)
MDNLRILDKDMGVIPVVIYVVTDNIDGEPIWIYRLTHAVTARRHDHLDLSSLGMGHFALAGSDERYRLYQQLPPRLKVYTPDELEQWIDHIVAQLQPSNNVDDEREMLNWHEVRRLDECGVAIGAHTCKHVLLSRVDDARARHEIFESRMRLTKEMGKTPQHFAYPNGGRADFSDRDVQLAREAGFDTATTSIEGINRPHTDRFQLLRYNVNEQRFHSPKGQFSKALFFSETSGLLGWVRKSRKAT